jgi:tetratricopeptide (TPR) repeat protein
LIAHARLAEVYSDLDMLDKAKDEILHIHSLAPERASLDRQERQFLDAAQWSTERDFDKAEQAYRAIAQAAPDAERARAYLDLGRAAENASHTDAAIEAYRAAAALPQNEAALLRLGMMLARKGQSDEALKNLNQAEDLFRLSSNFEGVTQTMLARARVLETTQGLDGAEAQLREALKTAALTGNVEHQVRTRLELGRIRLRAGRPDEAAQLAQEAVDLGQRSGVSQIV